MKKSPDIEIRQAKPSEAHTLSEIAFRSKAYWGYEPEFMEQVRAELRVTEESIQRNRIYVADAGNRLLGFYELGGEPPVGKLVSLFIDPSAIGQGLGKRMFHHAVRVAKEAGFQKITIDSDPYAEGFYRAMGAVKVGVIPSGSIPGRVLPLMEIDVFDC